MGLIWSAKSECRKIPIPHCPHNHMFRRAWLCCYIFDDYLLYQWKVKLALHTISTFYLLHLSDIIIYYRYSTCITKERHRVCNMAVSVVKFQAWGYKIRNEKDKSWIYVFRDFTKAELAQVGTFFRNQISALASKMSQIKKIKTYCHPN